VASATATERVERLASAERVERLASPRDTTFFSTAALLAAIVLGVVVSLPMSAIIGVALFDCSRRRRNKKASSEPDHQGHSSQSSPAGVPSAATDGTTADVPLAATKKQLILEREQSGSLRGASALSTMTVGTLLDALPRTDRPAIYVTASAPAMTHAELHHFVATGLSELDEYHVGSHDRVALLFPDGPQMVMALVAVMCRATAVPINSASTDDELVADLRAVRASVVISFGEKLVGKLELIQQRVAVELRLLLFEAHCRDPDAATRSRSGFPAAFSLRCYFNGRAGSPLTTQSPSPRPSPRWLVRKDTAVLLQTSGTTGQKKLVPQLVEDVIAGALCIAASVPLGEEDVNVSQMPLHHVGGILRSVFAPILSGGAVAHLGGFSPKPFWEAACQVGATWYYASPTMHRLYLDELLANPPQPEARLRLRYVANAAGGLPAALAAEMREGYSRMVGTCVTIAPSYGMTECMPMAAPPPAYALEKPGSSGIPIGPEMQVQDEAGEALPAGQVGAIAVRGCPVFRGYLKPLPDGANLGGSVPGDGIGDNGWFQTGDVGYLDADGYLFVTGRSKETIKRGGETITPSDIEEVLVTHHAVAQCAAFSMPHATLQEVVGVWVVTKAGAERPCLSELRQFCSTRLHPSKWPETLVHACELPMGPTGKIVRINSATRLGLPMLEESTPQTERAFEVIEMPPRGAPLSSPIATRPYIDCVSDKPRDEHEEQACTEVEACVREMWVALRRQHEPPGLDDDLFLHGATSLIISQLCAKIASRYGVRVAVGTVFLKRSLRRIAEEVDAALQSGQIGPSKGRAETELDACVKSHTGRSTRVGVLILQALPALLIHPMISAFHFSAFMIIFVATRRVIFDASGHHPEYFGHLFVLAFFMTVVLTHAVVLDFVLPLLGIAFKWLVLGRCQAGRHELWGCYYLRWWLATRVLVLCEPGVIFLATPAMRRVYLRLLGASIGADVSISGHALCQVALAADLVTIGARTRIDSTASVCAVCADNSSLLMQPVVVGPDCVVCCSTHIAPGAVLPDGACMGPLSSSHELTDASPEFSRFCRAKGDWMGEPPLWMKALIGWPCIAFVALARASAWLPFFALLVFQAHDTFRLFGVTCWNRYATCSEDPHQHFLYQDLMAQLNWWMANERLLIIFALVLSRRVVRPFVHLAAVILIKRVIIGRFRAGPKGPWERFQIQLLREIMLQGRNDGGPADLCGVHELLGRHWGGVSMAMRLLGAEVGKRVFWPGVMPDVIEFDLLVVGDDVTFGSRSLILCSDTRELATVTLAAGSMVADRCVVLPGVTLGRNATLGSGSLAPAHAHFEPMSLAVGSIGGAPVMLRGAYAVHDSTTDVPPKSDPNSLVGGADTLRPFGSTFYHTGEAGEPASTASWSCLAAVPVAMATYNCIVAAGVALLYAGQIPAALLLILWGIEDFPIDDAAPCLATALVVMLIIGAFVLIMSVSKAIGLMISIATKWLLIGQRSPGKHSWDHSRYLMSWKLWFPLLQAEPSMEPFFGGSAYLGMYYRALGATIGKDVCLSPLGTGLFLPEPDLVEIGDNTCVNASTIVCHNNNGGYFELATIEIRENVTLRSGVRVMHSSFISADARLLEHTLITPGDTVPQGATWQGWPVRS
jgi:acyl-CoA synthetase (AMP-forming)/AMP-acid ligase II/acetyltransferase-like isoleucine patch superfamily enzyme